jgi:enoyl-CoA hydratase/carnithine racemase
MTDIVTERSGTILRVQFNRPSKKNAMTSAMYISMADLFNAATKHDRVRVVLWHGAGDSFCAGNDLDDFLKNPPGAEDSPQSRLINAFIDFEKPNVRGGVGCSNRGWDHHADTL